MVLVRMDYPRHSGTLCSYFQSVFLFEWSADRLLKCFLLIFDFHHRHRRRRRRHRYCRRRRRRIASLNGNINRTRVREKNYFRSQEVTSRLRKAISAGTGYVGRRNIVYHLFIGGGDFFWW